MEVRRTRQIQASIFAILLAVNDGSIHPLNEVGYSKKYIWITSRGVEYPYVFIHEECNVSRRRTMQDVFTKISQDQTVPGYGTHVYRA